MKFLLIGTLLLLISCTQARDLSVVFTEYGTGAYQSSSINEYQQIIQKVDLKRVDLLFTCTVKDEFDPNINCANPDSTDYSKFTAMLQIFKKQNIKRSVRFYVDLQNQKWRAYWNPKDKALAFSNLKKELIQFSRVAEDYGVTELFIGSELEKLSGASFHKNWQEIITDIRKNYSGILLYAANGNINEMKVPEYKNVGIWDLVDAVGVNHYPAYNGKITYKKLYNHHLKILKKLKGFANKLKKPLHITEVGFPIAEGGIQTPYQWEYPQGTKVDLVNMQLNMKTFFYAAIKADVDGIHLWRFMPGEKKELPFGYIINEATTLEALQILNSEY